MYQRALEIELKNAGLQFERESEIKIFYKGDYIALRRVDFLVDKNITVELKAKTELLNLILENFKTEREKFDYYMNNLAELETKLQEGAEKTRKVASETLKRARASLGM